MTGSVMDADGITLSKAEYGISLDGEKPKEIFESEEEARRALEALGGKGRILVRHTYVSTWPPRKAAA